LVFEGEPLEGQRKNGLSFALGEERVELSGRHFYSRVELSQNKHVRGNNIISEEKEKRDPSETATQRSTASLG